MNAPIPTCLALAPAPRLITPEQPDVSGAWTMLAGASAAGGIVLILLAAACAWAWMVDRRLATDPSERAFLVLGRAAGLSSSQRSLVRRLAARLGPHAPPVALLLSRAALRRAVAAELEHKPEPRAVREVQRLVETLVGDHPTPSPDGRVESGHSSDPSPTRATSVQRQERHHRRSSGN